MMVSGRMTMASVALVVALLTVSVSAGYPVDVSGRNKVFGFAGPKIFRTKEQLMSGHYNMTGAPTSRIVNGDVVTNIWRARYVAQIWADAGRYFEFTCTGSVVDDRIVLTAAHCLEDFAPSYLICVSAVDTDGGVCVESNGMRLPSTYFSARVFTHDIALIRTEGSLTRWPSKAEVVPVDLARRNIANTGEFGIVHGYGDNNERATQWDGRLRNMDCLWRQWQGCVNDNSVRASNFVCVDGNYDGSRGGICFGDSGGPLAWSSDGSANPNKHVVVGVASFGYDDPVLGEYTCDVEVPSGYAYTASWQQTRFLKKAMFQLGGSFTEYRGNGQSTR